MPVIFARLAAQMTDAGMRPGAPETAVDKRRVNRRRAARKVMPGLAVLIALAVAGLVKIAVAGAHYQPLTFGDVLTTPVSTLPGLPAGRGITVVNTFGHYREDIYIPPHSGPFTLFVTVVNNGSRPVTIASAAPPLGLRPAGAARYLAGGLPGTGRREIWRLLHDYQLGANAEIASGYRSVPRRARCSANSRLSLTSTSR